MPRVSSSRYKAPSIFGASTRRICAGVHIADEAVVDDHGGVHDAPQRRHRRETSSSSPASAGRSVDVACARKDLDAAPLETRKHRLRLFRARAAPAEQHQVTRATLDQPLGGAQPEATEAARDQEAGFGGQFQARPARRFGRRRYRGHRLVGHDDLADLTGLLHVPEGIDDFVRSKRR